MILNVNQFTEQALTELEKEIVTLKGIQLDPTVSLCHRCHYHIPALRYHLNNEVYIVKNCQLHGCSHHKIESNFDFYNTLSCSYDNVKCNFNGVVILEVTDRCNLDCPHCYHLPENDIEDKQRQELVEQIKSLPLGRTEMSMIVFAGAEATIRKDFSQLISEVDLLRKDIDVGVMTNGVKFSKINFAQECRSAGLSTASIGLNHPDYIDFKKVRSHQEKGIDNCHSVGMHIGYVSYTMNEIDELDDILKEITTSKWHPDNFRIRTGSEIGRNSTKGKYFLSDIFFAVQKWADYNNKSFKIIDPADNNIYHIMIELDGKPIRLIQWCDETNIDMEELKSGPWCTFVDDGITNFLHQIIRRDILKNQKISLPDTPPERYCYKKIPDNTKLNLLDLGKNK